MSINYQMYLTFNNESEKLRLPELPETIEVTSGSKNESIDIAGLGEITIFQDGPALELSFSSNFPGESSPAQQNIETLLRWKSAKKPIHLIVTGATVNIFCSIENLTYSEKGGDVGTIYYSLTLKKYRQISVRTITVKETDKGTTGVVSAEAPRVDNRVPPKTYTVKSGDCLYNIAKSQCGNAQEWPNLASRNGINSPYTIYPGQVLQLTG